MLILACFVETCLVSGWQWASLALGIMLNQSLSNLHTCVTPGYLTDTLVFSTAPDFWPKMGLNATGCV